MSTTVHPPPDLLVAVDRRAKDPDMGRNRRILRVSGSTRAAEAEWSADFVEELVAARSAAEGERALEELRAAIAAGRTRKGPPAL